MGYVESATSGAIGLMILCIVGYQLRKLESDSSDRPLRAEEDMTWLFTMNTNGFLVNVTASLIGDYLSVNEMTASGW